MTDDEYADVRTLIREHAASPQHRIDVDEVIRRGRRSRQIRVADQVLAVAAVIAVAVTAGALLTRPHATSSPVGPTPTPRATASGAAFEVPTSSWKPGDAANQALLTGTLRTDDDGCVVVDSGGGHVTAVLWPAGTTGRRAAAGAIQLVTADGDVAASSGDRIAVGGGFGAASSTDRCLAAYSEPFTVMQAPPYTADGGAPKAVLDAVANARTSGPVQGVVQWVETTTQKAAALTSAGPGSPDVPIYIVQIQGDFVLDAAPRPKGAASPTGTVLRTFVPIGDPDQGGGGGSLTSSVADLSPYGTVHVLYP
jgi:hypothetical protein